MTSPCRRRAAWRRIAQALRWAVVCLLLLVVTDLPSTARLCLEDADGCGKTCTRCLCKRNAETTRVRPACPCCRPHPAVPGPLSDVGPKILPRAAAAGLVEPPSEALPVILATQGPSFTPSVPHPPPRTSPLA